MIDGLLINARAIATLADTASTNSFRIGAVFSRFSEHENNPIIPSFSKNISEKIIVLNVNLRAVYKK